MSEIPDFPLEYICFSTNIRDESIYRKDVQQIKKLGSELYRAWQFYPPDSEEIIQKKTEFPQGLIANFVYKPIEKVVYCEYGLASATGNPCGVLWNKQPQARLDAESLEEVLRKNRQLLQYEEQIRRKLEEVCLDPKRFKPSKKKKGFVSGYHFDFGSLSINYDLREVDGETVVYITHGKHHKQVFKSG